jgi:CheY-like chemotaxis protein
VFCQAGTPMDNKDVEESAIPLSPDMRCNEGADVAAFKRDKRMPPPFALVVDDDDRTCRFVATTLAQLGVECATYLGGRQAVDSLDQRRPDIIFLDLALERADAIDVIKWLSEKHFTGIVQLMSGGRLPLLEAVQRIGARHGLDLRTPLRKPVHADMIRETIAKVGLGAHLGASPCSTVSSDS